MRDRLICSDEPCAYREYPSRGNSLRISGKKAIAYPEAACLHRRERLSGSFDRTLTVPMQIDAGVFSGDNVSYPELARAKIATILAEANIAGGNGCEGKIRQ